MKRLIGSLALLFVLALSGCSVETQDHTPQSTGAPDSPYRFTLKNLEGQDVSLNGLLANHKAVLLNFWATWCPFCVEEIPDLIRLQKKFTDRSFTVVGVDAGESPSAVKPFLDEHPFGYPVVLDTETSVSETYGVLGLPTSILIRSDGKVIGVYHAVTPQLEADIEALLV